MWEAELCSLDEARTGFYHGQLQARGSYPEANSVEEGFWEVGEEKLLPGEPEKEREENSLQ